MAHHTPNRRSLTSEETAALDEVMAEYNMIRERARTDLIAARNRYQEMIVDAADRRDERIVTIIDAAGPEGRGTLARVIEYLQMNRSYLMGRLRKARQRMTKVSSPGPEDDTFCQHTPSDAEEGLERRETLTVRSVPA